MTEKDNARKAAITQFATNSAESRAMGIIMLPAPVCTLELYAERTGLQIGVVKGHVEKGYLPTVKHGKYRLINLVALATECLESFDSARH